MAATFNLAMTLTFGVILTSQASDDALGQSCAGVTTFNTGLTPVVADVNKRMPTIQKALRQDQSDVLCLQEVWYERSVKDLTEGLSEIYPYHYSKIHKRVGELSATKSTRGLPPWLTNLFRTKSACSSREMAYIVQTVGSCALKKGCMEGSASEIGGCLARNCRPELRDKALSQPCLSCTLFSLKSLTSTLSECVRIVGEDNRFNGPGLVLLSKKKINNVKYVNYFPHNKMWVERGYIEADIEDVGKVVCTHLSANLGTYLEFDTYFRNYHEQQAGEIRRLRRFRFVQHLLLGDLNTGPAVTFPRYPQANISGNFADNYGRLMKYGYRNPYVQTVKLCTYCMDNEFTKEDKNLIIDHVMYRGDTYQGVVSNRVLSSYESQTLSDHLGVQMRFCKINRDDRESRNRQNNRNRQNSRYNRGDTRSVTRRRQRQ